MLVPLPSLLWVKRWGTTKMVYDFLATCSTLLDRFFLHGHHTWGDFSKPNDLVESLTSPGRVGCGEEREKCVEDLVTERILDLFAFVGGFAETHVFVCFKFIRHHCWYLLIIMSHIETLVHCIFLFTVHISVAQKEKDVVTADKARFVC